MAQTLRSINILSSLTEQFQLANPDCDVPEELTVSAILVDEKKKFFCRKGSALTAEEIPSDTETFIIDTFDNECHWKHLTILLKSEAKFSINTLYLGHDGCIFGEKADIEAVICGLPNLREVFCCYYYAQYWKDLEDICVKFKINIIPIY